MFLITHDTNAQVIEWQKTLGTNALDFPEYLSITSDNEILVAGNTFANVGTDSNSPARGDLDFWLMKIDNDSGEIIWDEYFGGTGFDLLDVAFETTDNGYILAGYSESNTSRDKTEDSRGGDDYWIIKLDQNRNIIWQKTYGGMDNDRLTTIVETPNGGFLIGGNSTSSDTGDKSELSRGLTDIWLLYLNPDGTIIWEKTLGGSLNDFVDTVLNTTDGNFLIAGSSSSDVGGDKTDNSNGNGEDYWIIKLDISGNIVWQRTIGGNQTDVLNHAININGTDQFLLGGTSNSPISGDKSEPSLFEDAWMVRINNSGNIVWEKTIGTDGTEWLAGVGGASDGGFFLGVMSNGEINGPKSEINRGDRDYWGVKVNSLGEIEWEKTLGGSSSDTPQYVLQSPDKGYVIAGWSDSGISGDKTESSIGNSRDYWIVKIRTCEDEFEASSNTPVCENNDVELSATGGLTYDWTGPNGFTSNLREPIFSAEMASAGTYTVIITIDAFCTETATTEVVVNPAPLLNNLNEILVCDPEDDGLFSWDSSTIIEDLTNNQSNITLEFFDANFDALPNPLPNPLENDISGPMVITVIATDTAGFDCTTESSFTLMPTSEIDNCIVCEGEFSASSNTPVCEKSDIELSASGGITYEWTGPNGFTSNLREPVLNAEMANGGTYTVKITDESLCNQIITTEVVVNPVPILNNLNEILVCDPGDDGFFSWDSSTIIEDLTNNQSSITLEFYDANFNVLPNPLPNPFQNDIQGPVLINIIATDTVGGFNCKTETSFTLMPTSEIDNCKVIVDDFPAFFSPNGDGSNDYWEVSNDISRTIDQVRIFDRYGKLLTTLREGNLIWDGRSNDNEMTESTYWYLAIYKTNEVRKGYFALIR